LSTAYEQKLKIEIGKKRRQGNMTPQETHSHTVQDLMDSEGDGSPFVEARRVMIRISNELNVELKNDIQKQPKNPKRTWIKNWRRHRNN
jgi:hypothetical protein